MNMITQDKILVPSWNVSKVRALTTLKDDNLDLSPVAVNFKRNYNLLKQELLPSFPIWLNQVHGIDCVIAEKPNIDPEYNPITADASLSFVPQVVCAIRTADCMPILVTNTAETVVAAIHAGWRGFACGIVKNVINKLNNFGVKPGTLKAWIGPSISQAAFEVEHDVIDLFLEHNWDKNLLDLCFNKVSAIKYFGNLPELCKEQLLALGVLKENIYLSNLCTFSDTNKFYSFRRQDTGRMLSLIWLSE